MTASTFPSARQMLIFSNWFKFLEFLWQCEFFGKFLQVRILEWFHMCLDFDLKVFINKDVYVAPTVPTGERGYTPLTSGYGRGALNNYIKYHYYDKRT